jgi:hypothetical protein
LRNLAGRVEHHAVPSFPGDPEYKENTKLGFRSATDAEREELLNTYGTSFST